ncbi:hypothetical protein CBL_06156 [Carabus blaptoides fortunei]
MIVMRLSWFEGWFPIYALAPNPNERPYGPLADDDLLPMLSGAVRCGAATKLRGSSSLERRPAVSFCSNTARLLCVCMGAPSTTSTILIASHPANTDPPSTQQYFTACMFDVERIKLKVNLFVQS